jgi:asparagine synthase (glutamine-hydrolysing)
LIIARDGHGTRPLYVADLGARGIAFSTSMGPLLAAGASAEPDRDGVVRSLVLGYVPAPQTALAGVRQVGAGEFWTLTPSVTVRRYFTPREKIVRGRSIARAARDLDRALMRSVGRALGDARKVGAFLSGGIDSSLVLARIREAGRDVEAFTLHFGDRLPGELRYARAVAEHLGVRHHVLELSDRAFCDAIDPALEHLEDLLSEPIAVPNFLLAREAARSCDTLFTGEGGDPPFGGPKNLGLVLSEMYREAPLAARLSEAYLSAHHHLADDLDVALTAEWRAAFRHKALDAMIGGHLKGRGPGRHGSFVGSLMLANIVLKGSNNILVKVAKMVGAADVSLRSPLFDAEVVALALSIPPEQKLWGQDEKIVLKRVASRSLPAAVVHRSKRGMAVPLVAWFRGALGALAHDILTPRAVRERGIFERSYVERLLRLERMPTDLARSRSADKLWLVLVTELQQRAVKRLGTRSLPS